jgi:hypothetical protein
MPGGKREKEEKRGHQQQHAEKDVQGAATRGRQDYGDGFHGFALPAFDRSEICREHAKGAGKESQSSFYYRVTGGGLRAKTGGGNLGVDPLLQRQGLGTRD